MYTYASIFLMIIGIILLLAMIGPIVLSIRLDKINPFCKASLPKFNIFPRFLFSYSHFFYLLIVLILVDLIIKFIFFLLYLYSFYLKW